MRDYSIISKEHLHHIIKKKFQVKGAPYNPFRYKSGGLYVNGFSLLRMFPSLNIFLYKKVMFSSLNSLTLNINENTPKLQQILNSYVPILDKKSLITAGRGHSTI